MISSLLTFSLAKKGAPIRKSIFIFFALFFINSFVYSQNPVAEVYSGRIQNSNSTSAFYFRILDVSKVEFEDYYKKSQQFILFSTLRNGYSEEYKTGAIYYSSTKPFNLTDIQSLLKELGFSKVKYDDAMIGVNELPGKVIVTPERSQRTATPRN